MNKILPLISLFIMSIISIFYWTFKPKETFYEAKWNAPDTTIAITINGEISTTFPTTDAYDTSVECTSGTGSIEWNGSKWILTTSGITKGSTKCNIAFIKTYRLNDIILADNEVKMPLTTPGAATSFEEEALLASTEDDYGTSYYFRGAVKNNYVQFANKCWRIVRITGDSSVKLVLHNDNISSSSSPCSAENNSDTAAFARYSGTIYINAFNSNYMDNAYVGFMYGSAGVPTYSMTHANTSKSTILTSLETWYKNNLMLYEGKLADTIWCNDKSTRNNDLGYITNNTVYAAYNRLNSTKTPTLKCPVDNNGGKLSMFTVSDTTNGNGNLTYKIGLLTADEIAFSGSTIGNSNSSTYLYENAQGNWWWTLSPANFIGSGVANVLRVSGGLLDYVYVGDNGCVRPSISLVSSTTISGGSGTPEDPYVVK